MIGAGYTGLSAAWELARRRRRVVVVDRHEIGRGASARNGGMVHPGTKHDLATMLSMPGGRQMWDDTVAAFEGVEALVGELGIDCDWRRGGHLELAAHPRHAAHLRRWPTPTPPSARMPGSSPARARYRDRFRPLRRRAARDPQRLAAPGQAGGGPGRRRARGRGAAARPHPGVARRTPRPRLRGRDVAGAHPGRRGAGGHRRDHGAPARAVARPPDPRCRELRDRHRAHRRRPRRLGQPHRPHVLRHQELPQLLATRPRRFPPPVRWPHLVRPHHGGAGARPPLPGHAQRPPPAGRRPRGARAGAVWSGSPSTAFRTWAAIPGRESSTPWATAAPVWRCPPISAGPSGAGWAARASCRPSPAAAGRSFPPGPAAVAPAGGRMVVPGSYALGL